MTTQRKVRKDFDPTREYSVDVSECTEEEKKAVQQAFFDIGILWTSGDKTYRYLSALQYSNAYRDGVLSKTLKISGDERDYCNMTAKEFLELVYEPEQQGHVHAESMAQYAEDAKTHDEPWKLWEATVDDGNNWFNCICHPSWDNSMGYRRKPKTHFVHGVEIPDLRVVPNNGDFFYIPNPLWRTFFDCYQFVGDSADEIWVERGLTYQPTEEGKQAAILHAKAMLGIV